MRSLPTLAAASLTAGLLLSTGGEARAAGGDDPAVLTQESVGLEITPVAGYRVDSAHDFQDPVTKARLGLGATVRLLRHRWAAGYWTPIQAGVFVGGVGSNDVILGQVLTEGGGVLRQRSFALEIGLGVGAGILAVSTGDTCDGSCRMGGKGIFVSPVLRLLFRETAPLALGVVLRAEIPLSEPHGSGFGYFVGYGNMLLAGIDVAYGR